MTKTELIDKLKDIADNETDIASGHSEADTLLLDFINDKNVKDMFDKIEKWYA